MPSDRNRSRSPSHHRSRSPPRRRPSSRSRSPARRRRPSSRSNSPPRRRRTSRSPPPSRSRRSHSPPSPERQQRRNQAGGRGRGRGRGRDDRNKRYEWGRAEDRERPKTPPPVESEEPNFGLSGKLAAETNTVKGVELKYNEPAEAAKPKTKWRLYVFKGDQQIDLLHIHRQSAFLFGRDRVVADIPVDHPSCSKQHAVLQFRLVPDPETNTQVVKPFIIDLESTNGTFLNGDQIPATRFVEMRMKDVLRFGQSTREYVLLHST
ncbi:SMAD/FHA domain-containing protein [Zychaea mexicana]|uniref:SMAD/FHA domain-containing protein n=1 Tax=Zychaea mexicana TaxID=64656 RepID=UPI0022FE65EF|nr:SMAD/FHA domain-containing protein [Zychaea mexicana]KAI9495697.1 SMAD/FHA domain-containing protein [Zychaea mexicana]